MVPFFGGTQGHVARAIALSESLEERGYRVRIAASGVLARTLRARVSFVSHDEVDHVARFDREPKSAHAKIVSNALSAHRALLRKVRPRVVVGDLAPLMHVASALEGIPSVSVANLALARFPLKDWSKRIERSFAELDMPAWFSRRLWGDSLIVGDSPEWVGIRDLGPDAEPLTSLREIHFVGPILRSSGVWTRRTKRGVPNVTISVGGTIGGPGPDVLHGCIGVDANYTVVVSGKPSDETRKAMLALRRTLTRGSVVFRAFSDDFASSLLDADALITHGGHGTLVQALSLGVPTLVAPRQTEQVANAPRLRALGEFTSSSGSRVRVTLATQLHRLLNDGEGDARRRAYAASLLSYGGRARAAELIVQTAECRDPIAR